MIILMTSLYKVFKKLVFCRKVVSKTKLWYFLIDFSVVEEVRRSKLGVLI